MLNKSLQSGRGIGSVLVLLPVVLLSACGGPVPPQPGPATEPTAAPTVMPTSGEVAATTAPVETAGSRGTGDTLRMIYFQAPTVLNPHLSAGTKDLSASRIVYEPLATFDKDGNMVPLLAAEVPSTANGSVAADGKSVTWKLKQGIKWGDGEPFTSADVVFTYNYVSNPKVKSTSAAVYTDIESIKATGDYTVMINFKKVNPAWALPFTGPQGAIIPRHLFEAYNGPNASEAAVNLKAVGTGPYRVVEYKKEDVIIVGGSAVNTIKIIYEVNPYYREADKPYFSRLELLGGGDVTLAARAVQDGLVDYAWNLAVDDTMLDEVESGGKSKVYPVATSFVERIMLNFTDPNRETSDGERSSVQFPHPFLTDKQVRQAISMAIDRQSIAEAYGRGGKLTNNILTEPPAYSSPNTSIEFNPDKASTLLDEAGWKDTDGDGVREKDEIKLKLLFQTSVQPLRQLAQEVVKGNLEAIGFEVELKNIDSSLFFGPPKDTTDTRRQFYADLEEYAFSPKNPDPGAYMVGWTCAEIAQKSNDWALSNWARYCNPAYDALYEQAKTEIDPENRRQLFIQMNDLLIEDAAVIPLVHLSFPVGLTTDVTGFDFTPWDVEVWNVEDWRRK
ncbi:MAG TPA: peptide ABC transporter substrate-binding protein [Chloroflexia bacterium]|nr:peptide ABC transporter substrate-binding protein [Chloroflexia bacterium]